jgi:multidrug efflux system membrane fusion protein
VSAARTFGRVAALAALVALGGCAKHEPPPPPVRPVQLVAVQTGGATPVAVFAGEVKPRREADLAFRVGGKVTSRSVDVGARVRRGQVLARLDPSDVALQAESAKAGVAATETEWKYAQAEFDRYRNLHAQNFVSASALDQKRNARDATLARHEQAKAQLAVAQNQAAYATLVATGDGVITAVSVEAGQVVTAGQVVMKLADESEREIAIAVPENRLAELKSARRIVAFLWANPQQLYPATVREIAPSVDPVTRTFAVRVAVPSGDAALQWGMTANVALTAEGAPDAALLPLASLHRQGATPAVWIYDPATQQVALRPVAVVQYREDGVVVRGLANGEWVVAAGVQKLQPGQKVRPYEGGSVDAPPAPRATPSATSSAPAVPAPAAAPAAAPAPAAPVPPAAPAPKS